MDEPVHKFARASQQIALERHPEEGIADAEPAYEGTPLSVWLGLLAETEIRWEEPDAYEAVLEAVRTIGPRAIPSLIKEYEMGDEAARRRALAGFRALGGLAEAAAPDLFRLVERYPGYAPEALAAIGAPAVPFLQECLKDDALFGDFEGSLIIPANTMVGMHNAITLGGIPASEFYPLLPRILELSKSDSRYAVRDAEPLLNLFFKEMEVERTK